MMVTLPVKYDPARMQYTADCPDCKTNIATWTYEWCIHRLVTPPIGWDHDCPELNQRHGEPQPPEYVTTDAPHPTTKENK